MEKYENWKGEYYTEEKVDLKKELSDDNFEIIKKLGIELEDKIYTESEFEELHTILLSFYDVEKETPKEILSSKGIQEDEYKKLLENLKKIIEKYDF